MRRMLTGALVAACLTAIPGCEWQGLNSLSLPGSEGTGDGSYTIQAQLPDVVVIQRNTRVRVADVNVGNVTKIEVQDWHALVTMRIDGNVHLPANSTAKVGQTSLLGSMHIELAPPADQPPAGRTQGRFGDPVVQGQYVFDHRADVGIGVDPAQRRRAGPAAGDQPSVRQGVGGP